MTTQPAHTGPQQDKFEWDEIVPGLARRTRPDREPSWYIQIWLDGKSVRRSIGPCKEIGADDARHMARHLIADLRGENVPETQPEEICMLDFSETFLLHGWVNWKQSTYRSHQSLLRCHILPYFAARHVSSIDRADISSWMSQAKCSEGTQNRALAVLSGILRHAELLGIRGPDSNPCEGLRKRRNQFEAQRLCQQDYYRLGKAINAIKTEQPIIAALLHFLMLTGCRNSEARLLRWETIDANRAALPDSKTGPRAIWLGQIVIRLLATLPQTSDWVFTVKGKPVSAAKLAEWWNVVRNTALLPRLRIHDLRHGFASVAISSGEPLRTVSGLLGHSELQTTAAYAAYAEEPVQQAAERVAVHLSGILESARLTSPPAPCPMVTKFLAQGLSIQDYADAKDLSLSTLRQKVGTYYRLRKQALISAEET